MLLYSYNSNGYRGVVADEDRHRFNIASRNLIQDDVILPRFDTAGRPLSCSLEPQFPVDTLETKNNIPWDYTRGSIKIEITTPDGKTANLVEFKYVGAGGQWPTTKNSAVTSWRPPAYGEYAVKVTGTVYDVWGNLRFVARFENGSDELTKLRNQTGGTAVITLTYDTDNSLQVTFAQVQYSVADVVDTDGRITVSVECLPMYNAGIVSAVAKCNVDNICQ